MGGIRNELRNAAGLISKLRIIVDAQDLKNSFYKQILVPPTIGQCSLTLFALATALALTKHFLLAQKHVEHLSYCIHVKKNSDRASSPQCLK